MKHIRDTGVTVFLDEHDINFVITISDRITVLKQVVLKGQASVLAANPNVRSTYLGT